MMMSHDVIMKYSSTFLPSPLINFNLLYWTKCYHFGTTKIEGRILQDYRAITLSGRLIFQLQLLL